MSNAFDGILGSLANPQPTGNQGAITMQDLTKLLESIYATARAPVEEIAPPEHFYVTDSCQEHEDCTLVTCYPWEEGPARSVQHMQSTKWQEAMALSDWTHAPLELAPAWYRKRV